MPMTDTEHSRTHMRPPCEVSWPSCGAARRRRFQVAVTLRGVKMHPTCQVRGWEGPMDDLRGLCNNETCQGCHNHSSDTKLAAPELDPPGPNGAGMRARARLLAVRTGAVTAGKFS